MIEGVRMGSLDARVAHVANASTVVPELALFSVPYLFKDRDHYERVLNDPKFRERIDALVASKNLGIKVIGYYSAGVRNAVHPPRTGDHARRAEGHQDPRHEQPGRGQGLEHARHHPDADEFRRGLPGAAVGRAGRRRERARP